MIIKSGDLVRLSLNAQEQGYYPPSMNKDMVAGKSYKRTNGNVVVDVLCEDGGIRVAYMSDLVFIAE